MVTASKGNSEDLKMTPGAIDERPIKRTHCKVLGAVRPPDYFPVAPAARWLEPSIAAGYHLLEHRE